MRIAPIKFTSGTSLTTPEAGTLELCICLECKKIEIVNKKLICKNCNRENKINQIL